MDITTKTIGDVLVIKLHGRLSIETAQGFSVEFKRLMKTGFKKIILDCKLLDYVSSAGIQSLYIMLDHVTNNNGHLVMCSLTDNVDKVFKMINLESDIPSYSTVENAVEALHNH